MANIQHYAKQSKNHSRLVYRHLQGIGDVCEKYSKKTGKRASLDRLLIVLVESHIVAMPIQLNGEENVLVKPFNRFHGYVYGF